jgi:hypothetical protein
MELSRRRMYGCEEEDAMAMFRSGRSPASMTMSREDEDDDDAGIAGGTTSSTKVRWACSLPAHLSIFITNY